MTSLPQADGILARQCTADNLLVPVVGPATSKQIAVIGDFMEWDRMKLDRSRFTGRLQKPFRAEAGSVQRSASRRF